MNSIEYKYIYGSIFYELYEKGIVCKPGYLTQDNSQIFWVDLPYLNDFSFVLKVQDMDELVDLTSFVATVTLYVLPKNLSSTILKMTSLDTSFPLRRTFIAYGNNLTSEIDNLIKFLHSFKRHKKYYYYHCTVHENGWQSKLSWRALNRYYKKNKNLQ